MKKRTLSLFVAFVFSFLIPVVIQGSELTLVSGPEGSYLWELGNHISSVLNSKGDTDSFKVRFLTTGSDEESIRRLFATSGPANIAVVDSITAYMVEEGIGEFAGGPTCEISAIAVVGLEVEHFVLIDTLVEGGDIMDFTEKLIYLGREGDYRRDVSITLLNSVGVDTFFEAGSEWDYDTVAELMVDGSVDGAVFSGTPTVDAVYHLKKVMGDGLVLLEVPDALLSQMRMILPVWSPYIIAPNTYPGQKGPVLTIARPIVLVVSKALDDKTVKMLLEGYFSEIDSLNTNFNYNTRGFHPGAVEFFEERGVYFPAQ